jgi:hypothetical protein
MAARKGHKKSRRKKNKSPFHIYMSKEPAAIRKRIPNLTHRIAFGLAAKSWKDS